MGVCKQATILQKDLTCLEKRIIDGMYFYGFLLIPSTQSFDVYCRLG
jgi:hypothetical protein